MSQASFEVVPVDGAWMIRMAGDSVHELRASKSEAIARARELGRRYDEWHVSVLTTSGGIETELSSLESPPPS